MKIKRFKGAAIILWKEEEGKKYVLIAQRASGYKKGYYSNFGGHKESCDYENGKLNYMNTAIRETFEETRVISDKGNRKAELAKAKSFLFNNPNFVFNPKPIRTIHLPYYHHVTYECQVKGKMAEERWFDTTREHEYPTMQWYALDNLPKKLVFACKLNILKIKHLKPKE